MLGKFAIVIAELVKALQGRGRPVHLLSRYLWGRFSRVF